MRRAYAGGAGGGGAGGGGRKPGHPPCRAVRRQPQGGGHGPAYAARRAFVKGEGAVPPMPPDAFVKLEDVVKEEEGSGGRPKRQRTL